MRDNNIVSREGIRLNRRGFVGATAEARVWLDNPSITIKRCLVQLDIGFEQADDWRIMAN